MLNITFVLARRLRDLPWWLTSSAVLVVFVVSVWVVTRSVDPELLGGAADRAWDDRPGAVIVVVALFTAFALRAKAWTMVLSELRFGQALAAVHLALGANHVLPLRLGEATRIASVVRRARIPVAAATTTTIALRAADTLALLALGGATAALVLEGRLLEMTGIGVPTPDSSTGGSGQDVLLRTAVAVTVIIGVLAVGAIAFVMARRRRGKGVADISRLQLVAVAASVVLAWLAEAIAVWQITTWFDLGISPLDAVFVLAVAVSAQLVAVTPAGFGTYEAAATAALVAVGVDPRTALTVAVAVHGVKTVYALAAGATALAHPAPGLLGRWRLPSDAAETSQPLAAAGDHTAPVVLFLPAHDEGPRVASVIERTPTEVSGHPVEVLVIDDGSCILVLLARQP